MKKCISTCIFNAQKYKSTYLNIPKTFHYLEDPELKMVIYHDDSLTKEMQKNLLKYSFVILILKPRSIGRKGCFWRYEAYNDFDLVLFRDIDLKFFPLSKFIYNDFIKQKRKIMWTFIVHQRKTTPGVQGFILGGICGIKKCKEIGNSINQLLDEWLSNNKQGKEYGSDERFLGQILYPKIPPVVYYEPRVKNAELNKEYELYVKLDKNIAAIGQFCSPILP